MKAILLDADGVVLNKGEFFSEKFAREYNVPLEEVLEFFKGPFGDCQAGTKDLKEEVAPFLEKWGWQGSVDDFLNYWFQDVQIDPGIYELVEKYHEKGIKCYLASNNESYRARAIQDKLGGLLDGYFFSADLKMKKDNPEFFKHILGQLDLPANEVNFVDNDEKNVEAAKETGIGSFLYEEGMLGELLEGKTPREFRFKFF